MKECEYPKCDWLDRNKPACDCDKRPRKLMGAWTAMAYEGNYPPFVNVTQVGSMVRVTVRASRKPDGQVGDCISFDINAWNFNALVKALREADTKFDCELEPPLARGQLAV